MEKKFKKVPFNIELAKKIQSGEVEGKIMCNKSTATILDFDIYMFGSVYIGAFVKGNSGADILGIFEQNGMNIRGENYIHLYIELPEEQTKHEFKPFDKVLVRNDEDEVDGADWWVISLFMDEGPAGYRVINGEWYDQCIPYEGNECLAGTRNNPKED